MSEEFSEIKVLYADSPGSRDSLSDEERYHIFEQLAKTQPEWWKHIQSMVDMLREDTITNQLLIKPDLRELLLRKVITLDRERTKIEKCGALQRVVIPIVRSDSSIKGGAPPHMFIRKKASTAAKLHVEDSPNIIHVRFDTAIQCRRDDLDYIAPAGDDIIIEGWEIRDPDQSIAAHNRGLTPGLTSHFHHQPNFTLGNVQWWEIAPRKLTTGRYLLSDMNEKEQLRELTNLFTYFAIISQPQAFTNLMRSLVSTHAENAQDVSFILPDTAPNVPLPKIWIDILAQFNINSTSSRSAIIRDLYHAGIANAFYIALQKGRTDPNVTSALVLRQQQLTREEFRQRMIVADEDRAYKLNTLLVTIAKKISTSRAAEVEKKLAMVGGDPLKLLNPQEKKIVEIEVAKREKYLEEVLLNKCPHVKLYKQFRTAATTVDAWKILGELRHLMDKKATTGGNMITCNKCTLPIICPHIVALTEAEYLNKKYSETKRIIEEYVDTANTKEYFCKICGELLITSLDTSDEVPIQSINMNEELKTFMWSEMAVLTKFLKFPALINVPALITAQRDACYEDIFRLEKQILKSKTNSAEEIKAKKRLYVSIYSMAYMIQLVLTHKEIEFKGIKPGASLVELIKFGIDQLMIYCNVIIREIPGMTMDIIKGQMISAYKSIQSAGVIVTTAGEQEDIVTTLLLDPVYNYLVDMWNLSDTLSKNPDHRGRHATAESSIKRIIGDISTIEKNLIVGKTKIPYDLFANAKYPQLNVDKVSAADKPRVSYVVNSFNMFSKWIRDGKFKEPLYTQLGGKTVETVLNPVYQKARDELQQIIKAETEVELVRRANFTRVGMSIGRKTPKQTIVTPLGRLYDADGKPHKWSLLVVDNGEKEPAIMTTADISKLVMSGKRFTATIIDKKCETCGMLKSAANDIPEGKIRGNLQAMTDRDNFFRFYETRCPKGGAHTMVDVGGVEGSNGGLKCSQCGYKPNLTPLAYYKEHLPAWIEEKKGWAITPPKMVEARVIEWDNSYEKEYVSWSYNFNIVLDCASKLKINHRLLSVMGATEKVDYAEILSGAYIPPEAENRNDTRIYVLTTHIKNLMTEYLQLKNFHKLTKPSMDLTQVVENSGVGKYRMAEIGAKLPDIFNDFNARFAYIQRTKKPREIVNFCIQAICEMALRIFGLPSDPDHALRKTFIQYFMAKIFKLEETLTKPGYFSWSLLYGDKDQKETKDSNFTADDTDDGTVLDSPQDDEEDTPFGTDAYDMEDDDDPDDPGNQVRAGENLGLD